MRQKHGTASAPPAARSREGEGRITHKLDRASWQGTLPNLGSGGPTAGDTCIAFYCSYAVQPGLGPTAPAAAAPLSLSSADAAAGNGRLAALQAANSARAKNCPGGSKHYTEANAQTRSLIMN